MVKGELPPQTPQDQAMDFSIQLTPEERNTLLDYYRADPDPQLRLRAPPPPAPLRPPTTLLRAAASPRAVIAAVLSCPRRTIARWKKRFPQGRVEALFGQPRGAPSRLGRRWTEVLVGWVTEQTPRAF